ncbi:disulfide bond formation protein DsbA [Streptomyces sp. NPDC020096]
MSESQHLPSTAADALDVPETTSLAPGNGLPKPTRADLWCDPVCPWAWATARWLGDVGRHRPLELRFRVMSLAVLNEQKDDTSLRYRLLARHGWGPARLCIAAEQQYGPAALARLYPALARRFHHKPVQRGATALRDALDEAQLPGELIHAARSDAFDQALRASHHAAQAAYGADAGTPLLRLRDAQDRTVTLFGPVLEHVPQGVDAVRAWDALTTLTHVDGFREVKRHRGSEPVLD